MDVCIEHMAMWVDEARHERLAAQVDDARLGTFQLHHLVTIPDGDDSATLDCNGLDLRRKSLTVTMSPLG